jgi:hypothetical protein
VIFAVLVLAALILGFIVGCCIVPAGQPKKRSDVEELLGESLHSDLDSRYRPHANPESSDPSGYGVPEVSGAGRDFMFV